MIENSRAYLYAKWCVQRGNRKVGKYVKLQAKKWHKALITATNGSVVLLNDKSGEMVDVADDATIIGLYKKDGAYSLGEVSKLPYGEKTVYVKLDKDSVVTDIIVCYFWQTDEYVQWPVFGDIMG